MLFLALPAEAAVDGVCPRWRLSESAAQRIELALLTRDVPLCKQLITEARQQDAGFAAWAFRVAEHSLGQTINLADEAVEWLSDNLLVALSDAIQCQDGPEHGDAALLRLPLLVARLAECERALRQFHQRVETAKLESLKELAYGASHEINNPLANIAARAQSLLEDEADSERARKLSAIHRQAMRAHEMISDLMLFARPPKLVQKPLDVRPLLQQVIEDMRALAEEHRVTLRCDVAQQPLLIHADETQLGVAIYALTQNAIEALASGGNVTVTATSVKRDQQNVVELCVMDDGPGIAESVRKHMFDPFFSGREAGRGLGFGLSKCWRIVVEHGGQVVVGRPPKGASISIFLPLHPAALDAQS